MNVESNNKKDRIFISYMLNLVAFFTLLNGLHRLYNGKIGTGLLWLFTFGFFGFGQFVDLFLISNMVEEHDQKLRLKAGLSPLGVPLTQTAVASQVYQPSGNQLMVKLLEAAESRGGTLTVTQGVKATGVSFTEVEAVLKEMLKSGYVKIDNDPVSGAVTYHFHEI
ncbi:NINE protein [Scytonema hofmannii FACHB-248]|uniref:NINE protein n=1 Tax=Scytonema hofmannii FACHB-248 TaxID=1842502 RepID=A0ABR8GL70_9CYAN|nr:MULTISPECIES: NINE protein [Nostocales]MBD2603966.1 NINE protein [Scytonema hofmannii FACHB-248]